MFIKLLQELGFSLPVEPSLGTLEMVNILHFHVSHLVLPYSANLSITLSRCPSTANLSLIKYPTSGCNSQCSNNSCF